MEYKKLLYGGRIVIYTHHENPLVEKNSKNQAFMQKQKIEEFGPLIHYIKSLRIIEADALSILPTVGHFWSKHISDEESPFNKSDKSTIEKEPIGFRIIVQKYESQEPELLQAVNMNIKFFMCQFFERIRLYTRLYLQSKTRIVITAKLQYPAIMRIHSMLGWC